MQEIAKDILKKYYGYSSFRKGQEQIITSILEGNDTFVIMPTGGGKSLCYQIPAMILEGITIVVSPLISLMKDQVDTLNNLGIPAACINSSISTKEVDNTIEKARDGEYKLLYVAPERLEVNSFIDLLNSLEISQIAIDEAHCVSQWGHDFRTSYRVIAPVINTLRKRPIISAFTATATENVKEDIIKLLTLKSPNTYVTGFDRKNLCFRVIKNENKKDFILKYVEDNNNTSGIIYAATRKEVDNLYELLKQKGYEIGKYHAGMNDSERNENQEKFLYDDYKIIVATNAFGMGIDKSNVRYVIHYNMTKNMEAYYQEAGRAGRDEEPSECILLFSPRDVMIQKYLIEQTILNPERKYLEYKKLQEMVDYCHTSQCLRKYILEYFGENNIPDKCDNCSNCKDDSELKDITIEAQKIFSCIYRMNQRYGTSMIADVLRGSKNKKVLNMKFDKLSTYGIIKDYTIKEIKDLINVLIADQYLMITEGEYPVVKLRQKSIEVIKNKRKVMQKISRRKEKVEIDNSLFDELRILRREIAERQKVPPYIIFADSSLKEMSTLLPTNKEEMLHVKGVGETKFERYGEEFLKSITNYMEQNNIIKKDKGQHNYIEEKQSSNKKEKIPSHIISLNMYKEGMGLAKIAESRELKIATVKDHIIKCALEGYEVNFDGLIPEKYENLILEKINEIGCEKLTPIKKELPDEVEYNDIKAVICKYKCLKSKNIS
ncbi:DNA helicase RecQ [Haloimpatiens sp. FM7330]|uniref:DNA helicase RecQ n=1 Tax=Haloimpatiens sp. FM7330 TaxID=3298610 RepID=UPI003636A70B